MRVIRTLWLGGDVRFSPCPYHRRWFATACSTAHLPHHTEWIHMVDHVTRTGARPCPLGAHAAHYPLSGIWEGEARTVANRSGFSSANAGFFGANVLLASQSASGAIAFHGTGAEKGDSGSRRYGIYIATCRGRKAMQTWFQSFSATGKLSLVEDDSHDNP